ncbi:hypothetical protein WMY93_022447 [Mugilogobius chulae]|uniref:Ig-like domain-containing protein n=1 Tax=Mugilogobius chulae TaxID=88201 RepID=A0AAW0N6Z3_9GOBI
MSYVALSLFAFMATLFSTGLTVDINGAIGKDVVLKSPSSLPSASITRVVWKHEGNIAAEWDNAEDTDYYNQFIGQSRLNRSNGELTINNLNDQFKGEYVVEINGKPIQGSLHLIVYPVVPKPHISVSCNEERTHCTLTCEGDVAAMNPKPTYIWVNNTEKTDRTLDITSESTAPEFICRLKNLVSEESKLNQGCGSFKKIPCHGKLIFGKDRKPSYF